MLAQRAHNIVRQSLTLIYPTANLADIALLSLGLRLRFYIILVEGVGHGFVVGDNSCLVNGADEHTVGIQIHIAFYLQGHEGVDIPGQKPQTVVGAQLIDAHELICRPSALESEILEH